MKTRGKPIGDPLKFLYFSYALGFHKLSQFTFVAVLVVEHEQPFKLGNVMLGNNEKSPTV